MTTIGTTSNADGQRDAVGWLGAGRMGTAMIERLLAADVSVAVWNRTPGRTGELVAAGATAVASMTTIGTHRVVFSMVADDAALDAVTAGLFSGPSHPEIWVECSTVSVPASERAEAQASAHGCAYICAPVSGNPGVVRAGKLVFAVSGPGDAQRQIAPMLAAIGRGHHDVGRGHQARVVKLCTNLLIATTAQILSEATVLGESAGVRRTDLLGFINDSAVGSPFTAYKSEAIIRQDFTPTFTPELQRKDVRLALELASGRGVSMPLAAATEAAYTSLIDSGLGDGKDFISVIVKVAHDSGLQLADESGSAK